MANIFREGDSHVRKKFNSRTILLKPGDTHSVGLGSYASVRRSENFTISTQPNIGEHLGASLEMVDIPGTSRFMGLYHLHNFGDKPCEVTISSRTIRSHQ